MASPLDLTILEFSYSKKKKTFFTLSHIGFRLTILKTRIFMGRVVTPGGDLANG